MTPEEFIKNNPFPSNGTEINNQLVADIQNPDKQHLRRKNLELLLKNNARMIYLIWQQYPYGQELASVMSFMYQGLDKACTTYNPEIGMPFYHYATNVTRGLIQNYYNYNEAIIHVPVMKRKMKTYDPTIDEEVGVYDYKYSDINDYSEHHSMSSVDPDDNDLYDELTLLINEFEVTLKTDTAKYDLDILKMSRTMTLKDISENTRINTAKLRKIIDRTTNKLQLFHKRTQ